MKGSAPGSRTVPSTASGGIMTAGFLHGDAIMQQVEAISEGTVVIGPGTLYGAFSTLKKQGLLAVVKEEARRKYYALTERGQDPRHR